MRLVEIDTLVCPVPTSLFDKCVPSSIELPFNPQKINNYCYQINSHGEIPKPKKCELQIDFVRVDLVTIHLMQVDLHGGNIDLV